ncbi:MAG: AAA family ATPase [Eubacterium sp.]|nr:AAA family ATPase [Eubacterium sp.]
MRIDGKTTVLGVIGNPIEHTLSPVIHNTISEKMGINAIYVPIKVEYDIEKAVQGAEAMGFGGLNITVPYKQDVMKSLVEVDELAEKIGAVNTLVPASDGFKGYNTDMPGLFRALTFHGVCLEGKEIVVIGAGGASRAVCAMLVHYGAEKIYLINRSIDKAQDIASLSEKIVPLGITENDSVGSYKDIPEGEYIAFQCTSLGLRAGDPLLIDDDDFYKKISYGYDLIYNPAETPFTLKLKSLGIPYNNGLTMLLYQAVIAYELWFDVKIPEEICEKARRALFKKVYRGCDNIVLTGYMGSGKSTVGRKLAEKLERIYIDVDEYIVESEKKSIPQIFEEAGEEGFRMIETRALREIHNKYFGNAIIATGGGVVLKQENREILKDMGNVFYLFADVETTFNRVKGDSNRPLLSSNDEEELKNRIETMIGQRRGYYELSADFFIDTNKKNIDEIVDEVIKSACL